MDVRGAQDLQKLQDLEKCPLRGGSQTAETAEIKRDNTQLDGTDRAPSLDISRVAVRGVR
jgi:hypothetical protein